jgi:hypothetical protein
MIRREAYPVKKIFLWLIVFLFLASISFVIFIAIISIKTGLTYSNQDGFIVPILAGVSAIAICLFFLICFIKFLINIMREKDIIKSSI